MFSFSSCPSFGRLVNELSKLPSVGGKTAFRLAYSILSGQPESGLRLSKAIASALEKTRYCESCFSFSEENLCAICLDGNRDSSKICVVEKPLDVFAIEKSGTFNGLYHVLHKLWSPLKGSQPDTCNIDRLLAKGATAEEVIIATPTTVEGDATALFIAEALNKRGIRTSRIAQGIPKGGELEYSDDVTLSYAFQGRVKL